jgi:hypothetical protein
MAARTLQVTLTGSAQPITTNNLIAGSLTFQNNAAAVMRVGDANVTASRGYSLAAAAAWNVPLVRPTQLSKYYVIGTATQVLDVIYDDGGL